MNQELAGVEARRQFEPKAHAAFRTRPPRFFWHVFVQSFVKNAKAHGVELAHFREMFCEVATAEKFRERSLRQLVGVQVGGLLHQAQTLDGGCRRNDPAYAKARKGNFGKAVDVNDQIRAVHLLQRRNAFVTGVQSCVNMVFNNRNLMARSQFKKLAARSHRHGSAGGILEVRCQHDKFYPIRSERCFQGFEIHAERFSGLGVSVDGNAEAAGSRAIKDCASTWVSGIFHDHAVAWSNKSFADQVERLLTAVGNQQVFVLGNDSVMAQKLEQRFLERSIAIGRAEIEHVGGFAA